MGSTGRLDGMTTQLARLPGWTAHIGVVAWSTHWRFSTLDLLFRDSENLSSRTVLSRIPVSRLLWRADHCRQPVNWPNRTAWTASEQIARHPTAIRKQSCSVSDKA